MAQAVGSGAVVDLSTGDPAVDDPARGAGWAADRTVRAELVAQLVTGTGTAENERPRAVRLRGARLVGVLDLEATVLLCPLVLESCHFDEAINLQEAQAVVIRLSGSHVPGIAADQLQVRGSLVLSRVVTTRAEVSLLGAHVGGTLDLENASLTNPNGSALDAANVTVDQDIYCRAGFTARGEVRLIGAHVSGQVSFRGATLTNPGGLALNADNLTVGHGMICREGFSAQGEVNLIGAHIGGTLDFGGATLTNENGTALNADSLTVSQGMFCRAGFKAEGEVNLVGAHIGTLDFESATLTNAKEPALNAANLTIDRDVYCRDGFTAHGEVRLIGAHINGQLSFRKATLINPDGSALNADSLTVGQGMFCRAGFTAEGEVNLIGAHIGGTLDFEDATLTNRNGPALSADGLTVDRDVYCRDGFTAHGEVRLIGAHINGQLNFTRATLTNPDGLALDLESARVGELFLLPRERPTGIADLTNARVRGFHDAPDSWPTAMRLRGFVYEALENDSVSVSARLGWLARHQDGYAPGLYDQLAVAYRRSGHPEAARRVGIAKQWHRRSEFKPLGKVWNWLLYLTVGYGYRTWLAGLWLAGLLAIGSAVFADAYPTQMRSASASVPEFQPVAYTLDVLLPIVDLGQKKNWFPQDTARVWSWSLTGAGWVLTTAVVAGLTNALKRD